ncbi:MAG: TetR/AcrR family transcriptional regulator [Actinomycetota bacterium]|nr:TetR/AcrR family transcriptional regulator [Actinomycetota bacterium]
MARTVAERPDAVLALAHTFRRHGYMGASLSVISAETGLGKGSLYNFFPGGKEEMAQAVLAEVGAWFRTRVYEPLLAPGDPTERIAEMFDRTAGYFESRELVCLFGAFALGQERERFASAIREYFLEWIAALELALTRTGHGPERSHQLAVDTVAGIQGALVISRALGEPETLRASLARLRARITPASGGHDSSQLG